MHFICSRRRIPPSCLGSERLGKGIGRAYSNWHLTSHLAFQNHTNTEIQKYNKTKTQTIVKDLERGIGRANWNWWSSHFLLIIDHHVLITVNRWWYPVPFLILKPFLNQCQRWTSFNYIAFTSMDELLWEQIVCEHIYINRHPLNPHPGTNTVIFIMTITEAEV